LINGSKRGYLVFKRDETSSEAVGKEEGAVKMIKSLKAPQVAVGAIILRNHKILLVKRNKDPNKGQWAIPGGSVKLGETLQKAVEREVREETGLIVKARDPVYTFDLIERENRKIRFHYVIVDLMADLMGGKLHPSDDASDARWFHSNEVKDFEVTESTKDFLRRFRFIC
jgi:8-oxo-dGTP diphosphatase